MDQQRLCFQLSPYLAGSKNARPVLDLIRKDYRLVPQKNTLKELQIQTGVGRQAEVEAKRVIKRVLPPQSVHGSGTRHIEFASIRVDQFSFEYHRTEILGQRSTHLVDFVVSWLKNRRLRRSTHTIERRRRVQAVVIECRDIPAFYELRYTKTVVGITD